MMMSALFHRLDACEQKAEAHDVVGALALALGFSFFSYAVPSLGAEGANSAGMLMTNYPQGWQDRYQAKQYQVEDPVLVQGHRNLRPFAWGGGDYLKTIGPNERRLFIEAQAFGIVSGFAVPVHGPGRTCGLFSVAGPEQRPHAPDVGHSDFHALLAIAQAVHSKFVRWQTECATLTDVRLSEHERLCLLWTTQGKTAWEVAQIIGRSKATVDFHLRRAAAKLGAVNKVHAAFKARELDLL
ncbi:helix-turn-helix transcriptional regulator [Lichenihabitans psoromatis]|uniref:helix-turn-helix transcriptional regulator n=1 Tax=Lichenihabitans psoromatis TaxID=2528642 RepID=UPI0010384607|nr:LuxR family transcriptional regulator [Lichenihabitans psoromatis]